MMIIEVNYSQEMGWLFAANLTTAGGHPLRLVANNVGSIKNNHFLADRQGFLKSCLPEGLRAEVVAVEGGSRAAPCRSNFGVERGEIFFYLQQP
jgi:hypothetical protein